MTHAQTYQHGMKAFIEGSPLGGNPYDRVIELEFHDAWSDGWLNASRARRRIRALEMAAHSHIRTVPRFLRVRDSHRTADATGSARRQAEYGRMGRARHENMQRAICQPSGEQCERPRRATGCPAPLSV